MKVLLIPFVLMLIVCWYLRSNILLHGKPFPRGFIAILLVLGIVPILNILVLLGIVK